MHYIDIFNEGRDTDRPLLSLYDDEGVLLFFDLITSSDVYKTYFKSGTIALVSFHPSQDLQTGAATYTIVDGKVKVGYEQGMLQDVLKRVGFTKIAE